MQAVARHGTIDVLDVSSISPQDISVGTIDARAGAAAVKAIETGTHLTMHGELDAITTAPICKAAIHRAGVSYPGHTEMLAAFTGTPHVVMMLCTPEALSSEQVLKSRKWSPSLNRPRNANNGVAFAVLSLRITSR